MEKSLIVIDLPALKLPYHHQSVRIQLLQLLKMLSEFMVQLSSCN